jgi:hypothetical protein
MHDVHKTSSPYPSSQCGHLLDGEGLIKESVVGEVLHHVFLHEFGAEIRVVQALDLVTNTAD